VNQLCTPASQQPECEALSYSDGLTLRGQATLCIRTHTMRGWQHGALLLLLMRPQLHTEGVQQLAASRSQ
jgi:hypothetical protein